MFAERNIAYKLKENRKLNESEEVFTHEEETETPEDLLNEDWRSGTFTAADAERWSKKMRLELDSFIQSIQHVESKYGNDADVQKIFLGFRNYMKHRLRQAGLM